MRMLYGLMIVALLATSCGGETAQSTLAAEKQVQELSEEAKAFDAYTRKFENFLKDNRFSKHDMLIVRRLSKEGWFKRQLKFQYEYRAFKKGYNKYYDDLRRQEWEDRRDTYWNLLKKAQATDILYARDADDSFNGEFHRYLISAKDEKIKELYQEFFN